MQLGLDVFGVNDSELWPDGAVKKDVCLIPSPNNKRDSRLGSEFRCGTVPLLYVGLHGHVAWEDQVLVRL